MTLIPDNPRLIPLAQAHLCCDCDTVGDNPSQCRACGSLALLTLAAVLNRAPASPSLAEAVFLHSLTPQPVVNPTDNYPLLSSSEAMEAQRPLLVCAGCGGRKDEGTIVCWECFKQGEHPLKYWDGTWLEWLATRHPRQAASGSKDSYGPQ
jgi:hypothetical protein